MACLLFLHGVLKDFLVQLVLVESNVNAVASGHQMIIVDNLQCVEKTIETDILQEEAVGGGGPGD